jgi:PAS domain S-box-containing protein
MMSELEEQLLKLQNGDHLCLLYENPAEQLPALLPLIQQGLTHDEQFIYVADDQSVRALSDRLWENGIDVDKEIGAGRLILWTPEEWRLPGELSSEQKAGQLTHLIQEALRSGFSGICFAVDMTWTLGPDISPQRLAHWEATINAILTPQMPARIICQYNRSQLSPEAILAALHTHPTAILDNGICVNAFYQAPLILRHTGHGHSHNRSLLSRTGTDSSHSYTESSQDNVRSRVDWMLQQLKRTHAAHYAQESIKQTAALAREQLIKQQINASERTLRQLMDVMPAGVYACDEQGRIVFYNRRAAELWGTEPRTHDDSQRYCPYERVFGVKGASIPPSQSPMAIALRDGKSFREIESLVWRADGVRFFVSSNIDPIRDDAGRVCGAISVFQDVSQRKQTELELWQARQTLAEQVDGLTRLHDLSTRLAVAREIKPTMQAILEGLVELHGARRGLLSLFDPATHQLSVVASLGFDLPALVDLGHPKPGEGPCGTAVKESRRLILQDVETDPVFVSFRDLARRVGFRAVHSTPILNRAGIALGVISVHFDAPAVPTAQQIKWADMYARHAADFLDRASAEEATARLAAIIEGSEDAIISKDLAGVITSWNPGAQLLFGYSAAEAVGRSISILIPAERHNEEPGILERIRRGERVEHYETVRRRKDGTLIDISLTVSPVRDAEGRIIGASKIARNISDRKRAEAELQQAKAQLARSNEQLEGRVSERTRRLHETIAQMEEFSYSVSHDLRAPVRAMHGYASATLEDFGQQLPAQAIAFLQKIVGNATRMDRLIQDILTYSRLTRAELSLQPVCLQKLVHDIVCQYPEMQPPRAEILVKQPLPSVTAHEPSLTQAISNLLSNAVKFVPKGTRPTIEIWAEPLPDRIKLCFKDNGIGIRPEYQKRLFGMFERVHPDKQYEGTGIGLAIVRKAIERMGGRVGVQSNGVDGSQFWIELSNGDKRL